MPKCKSCGARIWWVSTPDGRSMPVDDKPLSVVVALKEPTRQTFVTQAGRVVHGVLSSLPPDGETVITAYTSHWTTCPSANQHRGPREVQGQEGFF